MADLIVVVAALERDCPAHMALEQEHVDHSVLYCKGDLDYAHHLAQLWKAGEGFILLEHDIVPWPGAIEDLALCEQDWCQFRYPKNGRLIRSLGCTKFSTNLVTEMPGLWMRWIATPWWELENVMLAAVADAVGWPSPCKHFPPVAHLQKGGS